MLPLVLLAVAADPAEQFEARVRPVLVEHCHKCHAGDKAKGGLRLDSRAALLAGGDTGPAVVPGDPDKSLLVKAVRGHDPDLVMPPAGRLPANVIRDLEAWVQGGAVWPGGDEPRHSPAVAEFDLAGRKASHWAWRPLHDPPGDIDRFVRAKLNDKGLSPSPPAEPAALVRRLAFDLTGLPPTPEEAERFAANPSPAAYERLVDTYLGSVHFGERWGRHWLDVVRYADTRGHEFDHPIPYAWRYRDWVIRAFNRDLPLRQFLTEQIAGDRVTPPRRGPDGANESALGAGFWLLGEEVHSPVDVRQDQADRFDNRIDVFGKAVLGLTVACARCHDHKFDAIRAKDYYALFALLEASVPATARLDAADDAAVAAKLTELRGYRCKPGRPRPPVDGVVVDYGNPRSGDWLADGPGWGAGPVPAGGVVFEPHATPAGRAAAVSDRLFDKLEIDGPEKAVGKPYPVMRPGLVLRTPDFTVTTGKVFALVRGGGSSYAAVGHHTLVEGPLHGKLVTTWKPAPGWRWECHDLGDYRGQTAHLQLCPTPGQVLAVAAVVQADAAPPVPPAVEANPLAPAEAERLEAGYAALAADLSPKSRAGLTLWEGTPRPGRVFVRGSPKSPGEVAPPRLLEALAGTEPLAGGRLQLAEQVTDPAVSPLTYRTFANRLWHHLFGRGLVPSPDNLGALGEPPSHPELLDWLASRLVTETPKQVIRRVVLSATYRQSSREEPAAERADPGNALLHRQNLRRLEAEAVRDSLLMVSCRLDRTPFGPPVPVHVTPHQDGRGKPASGPLDGAGRRTVYVSVRRNFLSPFLLAFDAPNPFGPVGRRTVSNVPAQSLALLNDEFVHQQTAKWAEAVKGLPAAERLDRLYLAAFARRPTPAERAACERFLAAGDLAGLAHALANVKEFVYR
jgi:hypothetical protein